MPVVTPGDILARCRTLDARIQAANKVINESPENFFNGAFRSAWFERLHRWETTREQCGDWASRMWNFKWGPTLDDWATNQAAWEAKIQARTGVVIPIGPPLSRPSDETLGAAVQQANRFMDVGGSMKLAAGLIGGGLAAALVLVAWKKS